MPDWPGWRCALAGLVFAALPVVAQDTPDLSPQKIRADYQAASTGWRPVPALILQAFVAAEDRNFHQRPASLSTVTRAISLWYPPMKTQPSPARLPVTLALAQALNHEELLNWFVNGVFLGQGCYGVQGASQAYFGKDMTQLSLPETALLAALPMVPGQRNPQHAPEKAMAARNHVLMTMAEQGMVPETAAFAAMAEPLSVLTPLGTCAP